MRHIPEIAPVCPEKQSIGTISGQKRSKRDIRNLVLAMEREGHTKAEIAAVLGLKPQAVSSIMIRAGVGTGRCGATRRIGAFIPARYFRILKLLAAEQQASPSATLSQVIKGALPDLPTARKMVGRR